VTLAHHRTGSGETLVLIHGIGSRWQIWEPVIEQLARRHEVIALDLPGFGASPPDETAPTVEALAARVQRFFDESRIERPHVAGNSMGGGIALELARRGTVRSATVFSPIGFWTDIDRAWCQLALRSARMLLSTLRPSLTDGLRSPLVRGAVLWGVFARPWNVAYEDAVAAVDGLIEATNFDAALCAFSDHRFQPDGHETPVPVTVAWGTCDWLLMRRQAYRARRLLPEAVHLKLPGCGHTPFYDDPAGCVRVLLAGTGSEPMNDAVQRMGG
jgi:pimeloyl-ACP methyl ester carboxylesterase